MIQDPQDFLEQFAAIADNFTWQRLGQHICAFKGELYYDPMTALTQISTVDYVPRHLIEDVVWKLHLTNHAYNIMFKVLYDFKNDNPKVLKLRHRLEQICGLTAT
jgi:hypothetical protein